MDSVASTLESHEFLSGAIHDPIFTGITNENHRESVNCRGLRDRTFANDSNGKKKHEPPGGETNVFHS